MVMAKQKVDWDRCFKDLGAISDQVIVDLENRINPLVDQSPFKKPKIELGEYPPEIVVSFHNVTRTPIREADFRRIEQNIADAVGFVAESHGLIPSKQHEGAYSLRPNYDLYCI